MNKHFRKKYESRLGGIDSNLTLPYLTKPNLRNRPKARLHVYKDVTKNSCKNGNFKMLTTRPRSIYSWPFSGLHKVAGFVSGNRLPVDSYQFGDHKSGLLKI